MRGDFVSKKTSVPSTNFSQSAIWHNEGNFCTQSKLFTEPCSSRKSFGQDGGTLFRLPQPLDCTTECLFEMAEQGLHTFSSILVKLGNGICHSRSWPTGQLPHIKRIIHTLTLEAVNALRVMASRTCNQVHRWQAVFPLRSDENA